MIPRLINPPSIRLLLWILLYLSFPASSQEIQKVEPANWWVGMKDPKLQIMLYGQDLAGAQVSLDYPGFRLDQVVQLANPNYLLLELSLSTDCAPGQAQIKLEKGRWKQTIPYELKARSQDTRRYRGFSPADVIYLLMPDRFANALPENDEIEGMRESLDREDEYGRHGGDIQGIRDHVDYFKNMGITTLWLNPLLENDMPKQSYHGYAITDFYQVDARFGSNEDYRKLVDDIREQGMKCIMDMVVNHCGLNHYFIADPPGKGWVHEFPEFTRSNYRGVAALDPYQAPSDYTLVRQGWFDTTMPDLDQRNPLLARYLIQNSIWWIEYLGLDGIRMDTYSYPYRTFLADWAGAIRNEYPTFSIVGEVWEYHVPTQAYWHDGQPNQDGYDSNIQSVTDFTLQKALDLAFKEEPGWDVGLARIYYTLAQDHVYPDPSQNLIFVDNHDIPRYFTVVGEDIRKYKMGLIVTLTTRGIPQLYYGTELALGGETHGQVRPEFPGGWADHSKNAFTGEGLSAEEKDIQNFCAKLINWRKNQKAIHEGKLRHYIPEDGIYVYFRYLDDACVMVLLNNKEETQVVNTQRFAESMQGYTQAWDLIHERNLSDLSKITLAAKSGLILELKK